MSQLLIMPINRAILTATFKSAAYRAYYKVDHYGVDLYSKSDLTVFACGNGKVICAGKDSVCGNVVVVRYENVQGNGKNIPAVAVRCYHLANLKVKAGQTVTKDTVIGQYGSTGLYVDGAHLHLEIDADADHWQGVPMLYPVKSTFFYRGTDTMLDPALLLHPYTVDEQTITWSDATYQEKRYAVTAGFAKTAVLSPAAASAEKIDYQKKYQAEMSAHAKTKVALEKANAVIDAIKKAVV